jgi:hypothetical protein
MKNTLSIISDETFKNDGYGCILNGDLHVTPSLYERIFQSGHLDIDLVSNLVIIDVDELVYIENLEFMMVFAGQQVRVFNDGKYIGDGTVTCYPLTMKFEMAEVTMHFPDQGEIMICPVSLLGPISSV